MSKVYYTSSCCGADVSLDAVDYQRCPECKESCDIIKDSDIEVSTEYVVIEMEKFKWDALRNYHQFVNEIDFKLKEVKVKDDFFKDEELDKAYKKKSIKAYKDWQEYRFTKRHNIK